MKAEQNLDAARSDAYRALEAHDYAAAREAVARLGALRPIEAAGLSCALEIEAGDAEAAGAAWKRLAALAPEDIYTKFLAARIAFLRQDYARARALLLPLRREAEKEDYQERIWNLYGQCARILGDPEEAGRAYLCAARAATSLPLAAVEYSDYLFNLHYLRTSLAEQKRAAEGYGRLFKGLPQFFHARPKEKERLRIGYISADLRDHVVLRFVYALFSRYDKAHFEVYAYANCEEDAYSRHLRTLVTAWRNILGLPHEQAARQIYEDGIDILVDFSGHCRENSLPVLAYRPAPVLVSGIGYFASTGLPAVDYFLADATLAAGDAEQGFTEELLVLPDSHLCYTPMKEVPLSDAPPSAKKGYVTFGSFNNFAKVNGEVLACWREILARVPNARLFLKTDTFDAPASREAALARIEAAGIDLARVTWRGATRDYLAAYGAVDIALDTFPYPGGGTTCDALYMGVPVVTRMGESLGERFGASLLTNLGLTELVAGSEAEYVERAVSLAKDAETLALLHANLRTMMERSPLMDAARYLSSMEAGYRAIWAAHCARCAAPPEPSLHALAKKMGAFQRAGDMRQAAAVASHIVAGEADAALLKEAAFVAVDAGAQGVVHEAAERLRALAPAQGIAALVCAFDAALAGKHAAAVAKAKQAITAGNLTAAERGIAHHLQAESYKRLGRREKAARAYLASSREKTVGQGKPADYSNYLLNLSYAPHTAEELLAAAKGYGAMWEGVKPFAHRRAAHRHKRIRVGYISPDFCRHVVACFALPFFRHADKHVFEVYGYMIGAADALTQDFAALADGFRDLSALSALDAAKTIQEDEIDILVDLSGHTGNNALPILAYRPAPVVVSGIGYFATTGLPAVDYFLTDAHLAPEGEEAFFTEKLLRLPESHWCYEPLAGTPPVAPAPFLQNGYVTFGCLGHFDKVTDEMLALWGEILAAVPDSRLYLKSAVMDDVARREGIVSRLARAGIDAARVRMEGRTDDYLTAYYAIDIALDTFPYPGGGTSCDALYMGAPFVTCAGEHHHGRFGVSLLETVGLGDLAAKDGADYVKIAVQLAKDRARLDALHSTLRPLMQASALMDGARYMMRLERGYRAIWRAAGGAAKEEGLPAAYAAGDWGEAARLAFWQAGLSPRHEDAERMEVFAHYQMKENRRAEMLAADCLAAEPDDAQIRFMRASALEQLGELPEALALTRETLKEERLAPDVRLKLLQLAAFTAFKLGAPDTPDLYRMVWEHDPSDVDSYSSCLFAYNSFSVDEQDLFARSVRYGTFFGQVRQYEHAPARHRHARLRIGYLSPDFRVHVMFHFYLAMLAGYSRDDFEVYAYSLTAKRDDHTDIVARFASHFRDLAGLSADEAAKVIYDDAIDILVDLAGHTAGNGLPILARKPAPVLVSGLGYMATTGLPAVDYFLTDAIVDPAGVNEPYFTEELLRLTSHFCYGGVSDNLPASTGTPARQRGWILFGVFNNYRKITAEMLAAWREIMERVPKSKLLIKTQVFFSPKMVLAAYDRLASMGFDMSRVIFEQATTDYMMRYLDVDIALDTFPYPGGGTTCDALYMGVPVVTCCASRHSTRFSASILENIGLDGLVTECVADYVERAVQMAGDLDLLDVLHQKLRPMMKASPVMDMGHYMEELEAAYRAIWARWQEQAGDRSKG